MMETIEYTELDELRKNVLVGMKNELLFGNGEHLDKTIRLLERMVELQRKRSDSANKLFEERKEQ